MWKPAASSLLFMRLLHWLEKVKPKEKAQVPKFTCHLTSTCRSEWVCACVSLYLYAHACNRRLRSRGFFGTGIMSARPDKWWRDLAKAQEKRVELFMEKKQRSYDSCRNQMATPRWGLGKQKSYSSSGQPGKRQSISYYAVGNKRDNWVRLIQHLSIASKSYSWEGQKGLPKSPFWHLNVPSFYSL